MKYIIYTLTALVLITSVSYGAVKVATEIVLPKGKSVNIYSDVLDRAKVRVIRFEDGNTTCYVAYSEQNGSAVFTSLDCK